MKEILVCIWSWGVQEHNEPNPCSRRLAEEAIKLVHKYQEKGYKVSIVCQWEVGTALRFYGVSEKLIIKESFDNKVDQNGNKVFLDSDLVWEDFTKVINEIQPDAIIPVCKNFLHKIKIKKLISQSLNSGEIKAKVIWEKIGSIGSDPNNDLPQCRSNWHTLWYAIMQAITGKTGWQGK